MAYLFVLVQVNHAFDDAFHEQEELVLRELSYVLVEASLVAVISDDDEVLFFVVEKELPGI